MKNRKPCYQLAQWYVTTCGGGL